MPRAQKIALTFLACYFLILFISVVSPVTYEAMIQKPVETFDRIKAKRALNKQKYTAWFYFPARNDKQGVIIHKDGAFDGLTLVSDARAQKAMLMDMDGTIVHSWEKPFSDIWPEQDPKTVPPPHKIFWCRVWAQPNGDLYIQYCMDRVGGEPAGLTKLDKDSNLLWKYEGPSHHDMELLPDGDVYTLSNTLRTEPHPALPFINAPFYDEFIERLDHDGQSVERFYIFDMLNKSPAQSVLPLLRLEPADPKLNPGDLLHPNTITLITKEIAGQAPMLKEGHVLVSFRNTDFMAIFDLENEIATWASYGPYHGQHSPEFLPDGSLMLFDNEGNLAAEGGASRILRLDLENMEILWQYTGSDEDPFYSPYNGFLQPLPNGNVLVTETHAGRVFEVTREKEIVWEYYVPGRLTDENGTERIPSVFSAHRFTRDQLPFLESQP